MKIIKSSILPAIILAFLSYSSLFSQAGGAAVPFLLISPDARASGMGEVGTAIADDVYAFYWNPAGLGFHDYINKANEEDKHVYYQVSPISFSKWLPQFNADLYYACAAGSVFVPSIDGTIGANFIFMNLGEFTRTLENGQTAGKFLSNEFSVGVTYGTIVTEDLGVGLQARYIQSNLAPASAVSQGDAGIGTSGSFDLGILWKPQDLTYLPWIGDWMSGKFSLGINLQNVGPKMTYRNESDPLPTTLRAGTALTVLRDDYNDLKFAVDISKLLIRRDGLGSDPLPKSLITGWQNPGVELAFGAEYWYDRIVALRAGYFTEPARLGNRKYWNFGAAVRYSIFRLDFSFINTTEENHPLANTMRFTLTVW